MNELEKELKEIAANFPDIDEAISIASLASEATLDYIDGDLKDDIIEEVVFRYNNEAPVSYESVEDNLRRVFDDVLSRKLKVGR